MYTKTIQAEKKITKFQKGIFGLQIQKTDSKFNIKKKQKLET